eukprot:TRINITY_DN54478_c0_g1_i1.p1 TRINITY_DN54478_c0_g1~~TRINITY_DN54478_c0_g1_i1.p1  ORF type:complete len:798 (-),score=188.75 TRINITY_DN54478_c0_g1_i1:48-2318(-)
MVVSTPTKAHYDVDLVGADSKGRRRKGLAARATPQKLEKSKVCPAPPSLQKPKGFQSEMPPGLGDSAAPGGDARTLIDAGRLMELLEAALADDDVQSKRDLQGYVGLQWLLNSKPELQKQSHSISTFLAAVEEAAPGRVRLDKTRRRVRLASLEELVRDEALRVMHATPFGVVPLASLLSTPVLASALAGVDDSRNFLDAVLESTDVALRDSWIIRRPRDSRLRFAMEALFGDESLAEDAKLRSKLGDNVKGEVPLTWVIARYSDRLGVEFSQERLRSVEAAAAEICAAMKSSKVVVVDERRLTVRRAVPYQAVLAASQASACAREAETTQTKSEGSGSIRAAAQLRQLLDFYFEPFTLQNNRYLLDLITKRVAAPKEKGPWLSKTLLDMAFSFEDLNGLGRVVAAWRKLRSYKNFTSELKELKHLRYNSNGCLSISSELEVRSFVRPSNVREDLADSMVQHLAAAREQQAQAPFGVVSVLSYSMKDALADLGVQGSQRQSRIKRQLLVYQTDLLCLQGLDVEGDGAAIAAALAEECYGFACARAADGEANSIFWDRRRWELLSQDESAASISVLLSPFEDPSVHVRVVCLQAKVSDITGSSLRQLFGVFESSFRARGSPLIACTDLSQIGGAEAAGIIEPLMGLPSVAEEVLGSELAAPMPAPPGLDPDCELAPARSAAGLNKLRHPDAVFFREASPVVCLSGHTEGYLRSMPVTEVVKQFPCFRLPLVAAFDWRTSYVPAAGLGASAPCQRVRL